MKTAIYIEDGVLQLVLTPESDFEKTSLTSFYRKKLQVQIFEGAFYDCRGGWARQTAHYPGYDRYGSPKEPVSLILRVDESVVETPAVEPTAKHAFTGDGGELCTTCGKPFQDTSHDFRAPTVGAEATS